MSNHATNADLCLFFINDNILVQPSPLTVLLPFQKTLSLLSLNVITTYNDAHHNIVLCSSSLNPSDFLNKNYNIIPVKQCLSQADNTLQSHILKAYHCLNWHKQSQYCGQCGDKLLFETHTAEKKCTTCDHSFFPRFSPAVMVLIQRENEVLLARSAHFPPGIYSALAGFIDLGESAEQAAHREVKEEVGLEITDLTYFGTQTWPFPDSFMIAFTAQYLRGELVIDKDELEDARWFSLDGPLPQFSPTASIARRLIDSAVSQRYR